MNELKAGDIVQLKVGGPIMTVARVYNDARGTATAACEWFEGSRKEQGSFPVHSLVRV